MTTIAAPSVNEVQSTLAASYTRGTDTTITLVDGTLFPSPTPLGHVIRIANTDNSKWCLIIYTSKATHVLTMGGGATDYALGKNVTVGDEAYEWPIGSTVEIVGAADEIAQIFDSAIQDDVSGQIVAIAEKTTLADNDEFVIEDSAATNAKKSVKFVNFRAAWSRFDVKQRYNAQTIEASVIPWIVVKFPTETVDLLGEFDNTVTTGTADATEANKLHDADGGFTAGMVGATVWNTTDNTYTTVTAYVDSGELTLDDDIFVDTEGYEIFFARFTAGQACTMQLNANAVFGDLDDGKRGIVGIQKNGVTIALARGSSAADNMVAGWAAARSITLAANDYITVACYHDNATATALTNNAGYCTFSGHRVA